MSERIGAVRRVRPRKNIVMFAFSLALGAVAVLYSKQYIEDQIALYKRQFERTEEMGSVVVPNRSLQRGEILVKADIKLMDMPARYIDSNSVNQRNFEKALGQRIDFDIDRGKPLLWAHLEGGLTPTFSGKVPAGLRAITVRVDEINSISGFLQPEDRVDLLMSHGNGGKQQILPLIEQLEVIATGTQTQLDKNALSGKRSFTTITVQVSPHQAQQITLAQQIGKLTAMLRNPEDEAPLSSHAMTVAELLGIVEEHPSPPEMKVPVRRKPVGPSIEYIIGGAR